MSLFSVLLWNPLFWFPLLFAVWAVWRIIRRLVSSGRTPIRGRRPFTFGGVAGASTTIHGFYGPSVEPLAEVERDEETSRDDDDEGGPPSGGG
jgi:hypothetical protein